MVGAGSWGATVDAAKWALVMASSWVCLGGWDGVKGRRGFDLTWLRYRSYLLSELPLQCRHFPSQCLQL